VELLVVIAIIGLLMGLLVPALGKARMLASRTQCLSNIRQLAMAQMAYASAGGNYLVIAGDGDETQGSWIGLLQKFTSNKLVGRCPSDRSPYFDQPLAGKLRTTSYGINNYVSPTHAPAGARPIAKLNNVQKASQIIQFVELAETGSYATADHVHVQDFYFTMAPSPKVTVGLISKQMPLGRHGGGNQDWAAVLNFSFLDGHAESLRIQDVYTNPKQNRFDPDVPR
jgi:prepilin-type processing-associated H-X9-DG protein